MVEKSHTLSAGGYQPASRLTSQNPVQVTIDLEREVGITLEPVTNILLR